MISLTALSVLSLVSVSVALGAPQQAPASALLLQTTTPEPVNVEEPLLEPYALEAFNVSAINATAAEITFVLPMFALGKPAKAQLNYTGLSLRELELSGAPEEPPADAVWLSKPSIKTPEGAFFVPFVKYYLTNLKPEHKYWLDLSIVFRNATEEPFDKPMGSEMQTIVMPPSTQTIILRPKTQDNLAAAPSSTGAPVVEPASASAEPEVVASTTLATTTTSTTSAPTTSQAPTTTTSTTTSAPQQPSTLIGQTSTSTTSTTTTTTTTRPTAASAPEEASTSLNRLCPPTDYETNRIDNPSMLAWVDVQLPLNAPIQKYAWHLLFALAIMTTLFTIVSYLYLKKSTRVIAPISNKKPMDPTIAKLVSYYAILVDENNQNYANDAIMAKQKTLELEQSSPPPFIMNR